MTLRRGVRLPTFGAWPVALQWSGLIALGLAVTLILRQVTFPAASLVGPVIASTFFGIRGATVRIPAPLHRLGQSIAGCLIAQYLSPEILVGLSDHWLAVLVFVAATFVIACLVGWALGQIGRLDPEVTIWGFLPGMAGVMIAMSHERGLDSRIVAFIQILRVMAVILAVSTLSHFLSPGAGAPPIRSAAETSVDGLIVTALLCLIGILTGRYLTILPAGATLVPMVLAATLQSSGLAAPSLPPWLLLPCYLILGTQVGLRFTPQMLRSVARSFWLILAGVMVLLALCALSGSMLAMLVGESLISGILATVPGSVETVALMAVNSQANLSFVLTLQVVRLFAVVLAGPLIAKWLTTRLPGTRPRVP